MDRDQSHSHLSYRHVKNHRLGLCRLSPYTSIIHLQIHLLLSDNKCDFPGTQHVELVLRESRKSFLGCQTENKRKE